MGIGMVVIVDAAEITKVKNSLKNLSEVYRIGSVIQGKRRIRIIDK